MERKNNINSFGFFTQTLVIFAVTTLVILGIGLLFGDKGKEFSTLFELGGQGISNRTLVQFLISSFVISAIEKVFQNEHIFTSLTFLTRTIIMILIIVAMMVIFIISFGWFPAYSWQGWIGFILSFGICFGAATIAMIFKKRQEDKRYEEFLEEYKKRQINERK